MKNVGIRISAALLLVWYSMSIIGFDVHTCYGTGRSFVVTFVEGLSCEDIHPEHVCNPGSCGSHHHERHCCNSHESADFFKPKPCCSSDYQVLSLTGILSAPDHQHYDECSCGHCPCVGSHVCGMPAVEYANIHSRYRCGPDPGVGPACKRQAALHVWRI